MFKLIKLAIYGVLGYAIYEFMRGLLQRESMLQAAGMGQGGQGQGEGLGRGGSLELNRALDRSSAGRMNMTGPAQGARVMSEEPSGESVPHMVGRGVVHR